MTHEERERDQHVHDALRALGSRLPEPQAPGSARIEIEAALSAARLNEAGLAETPPVVTPPVNVPRPISPEIVHRIHRLRATVFALAACLTLVTGVCLLMMSEVYRSHHEIVAMRDAVTPPMPEDLADARFAVVNVHHGQCPNAKQMTPRFRQLAAEYDNATVVFLTLDLSESCVPAMQYAKALGVGCIFEQPPGMRTGVVRLVDLQSHEIVGTAMSESELPQLKDLIASSLR